MEPQIAYPDALAVVHVIAGVKAAHGGPSYSVPQLCRSLAQAGAKVHLLSVKYEDGAVANQSEAEAGFFDRRFRWDYATVPLLRELRCSAELADALRNAAPFVDLIHDHGIWLMPNIMAGSAARRSGKPFIVSPRGMLAPAALEFSRLKKRAFWTLLQGSTMRYAACVHATSEQEYQEIRNFGLRNPVAIIANGIEISERIPKGTKALESDRVVLSLGRLHPKKGLDTLLYAWSKVEVTNPGWRLRIVGPSEKGYNREVLALIARLGLSRVSVEGPLYGDAKAEAYGFADVFVLSSLNENFGQTVAEALAAKVPVICSKGAPWSGLEAYGCGWWIDHGVEPLTRALEVAMALPGEKLAAMGAKGSAWMARDFSWQRVSAEMVAVYNWLTHGGEPASTIRFD